MKTHIVKLKFARIAPRKMRAMADVIRGLSANDAEAQLHMQSRRAAKPLLKLLRSGLAGAKAKQLDPAKLIISAIAVDQGPMLKRSLPRAMGRATPLQKKMSHVTLTLSETEKPKPSRFTIVKPKKVKVPPVGAKKEGEDKEERAKTKTKDSPNDQRIQPKNPGFFKKMFRRKAGFAK